MYQPKTGERCHCREGVQRDNCPDCEGTGWRIDFEAIRSAIELRLDELAKDAAKQTYPQVWTVVDGDDHETG